MPTLSKENDDAVDGEDGDEARVADDVIETDVVLDADVGVEEAGDVLEGLLDGDVVEIGFLLEST